MIDTFMRIKKTSSPTLIHVITKKGKGYEFAEEKPSLFHGIGPFDCDTGEPLKGSGLTYSEVFGDALTELAEKDEKVVAITAAMKEGTGLQHFARTYPDRFYDVGIAEPHAVTFAAGLATQGMKPVVAIYSTFLQRAYDQILHDVCLQNLHVVFAIDRAGIVGEDGPTHNGVFDVSYLRHIPNIIVMEPKNGEEMKMMLRYALRHEGPVAIRYPRGKIPSGLIHLSGIQEETSPLRCSKAEILREGTEIAFIALGETVFRALSVAEKLEKEGIDAMVINARFVKPLDRDLISAVAAVVPRIVTIEENTLQGGFGCAVLEILNKMEIHNVKVKCIGIPDGFLEHAQQSDLRKKYGLDEEGIYLTALSFYREPLFRF
jgi:1-deoxy-D-xylulose-5-phosphate synthase